MVLYFFTFCININKHSKTILYLSLINLLKSIEKHNKNNYELQCFTNFELSKYDSKEILNKFNLKINNINFSNLERHFDDDWLNLSYNKITIYKYLFDQFKIDYIWIDLDTIVTSNLSYLEQLDHFFIENGGKCQIPIQIFRPKEQVQNPKVQNPTEQNPKEHHYCAKNRSIQGNFWKINIELYEQLIKCYNITKEEGLELKFDLQSLFSYYINVIRKGDNFNILGNTLNNESIYGMSVWDIEGYTHLTKKGFENLYYDGNDLKTFLYPGKSIHILSMTFNNYKNLLKDDKFNNIIN